MLFVNVGNNRVGIANSSPSEALDVTGNQAVSGNVTAGGNVTATGSITANGITSENASTLRGVISRLAEALRYFVMILPALLIFDNF